MTPILRLAGVFALTLTAAGPAATIPLKAGDYGVVYLACANEPNAAIMSFDGRTFSYPHATKCTDTITGPSAGVLSISETCSALGDGSPTKPDTSTFTLRPHGADRFTLIKSGSTMTYRRCGSPGYFGKQ